MKRILIITGTIALLCLLTSCSTSYQTQRIKDVRKQESIAIAKLPNSGYVHAITISVTGSLNGTASLALIADGKRSQPYKEEKMHDRVNLKWDYDWYSDTALIRYTPIDVNKGELTVRYRFWN